MAYYNYYFATEQNDVASRLIQKKNQKIAGIIQPFLNGRDVIELGVGKGYFAVSATDYGLTYCGVEASAEQCLVLREHGLSVKDGLVPPIPAETASFDLVYTAHLLEHLPDGGAVFDLFTEASRILRDGGVLAILFPNYMTMKREFWNCDYTHAYPTTERRIRQLLRDTGFEPVLTVKFAGHFKGPVRYLFKVPARIFPYRLLQFLAGWAVGKENIYRGWMYFQEDVLVLARKKQAE